MMRLPATGRLPGTYPDLAQAERDLIRARLAAGRALLNLPSRDVRPLFIAADPPSQLPETPLGSPIPIGAENVATAIAALAVLQGKARALEVLALARKATIYSGHPGLDAATWAAYAKYATVERAVTEASNAVLTFRAPTESPIKQAALAERFTLGYKSQEELDRAFLFGQSGDEQQVLARIRELKLIASQTPGLSREFLIEPKAAAQLAESIEAGFALRPLLDAQRDVALDRVAKLAQVVNMLLAPEQQQGIPAAPAGSADP